MRELIIAVTKASSESFMRITSGKFGGRNLFTPDDARTRPTSDKVRQAIFNILRHRDFGIGFSLQDARVADLFAGTGALGLEALSQGARYCLFVEEDADARGIIRQNIDSFGLTGATKIWRRDARDLGPMNAGSGGPFDLVFADPPYRKDMLAHALASLKSGGWLSENSLLVLETAEDERIVLPDGFNSIEERIYGETRVLFVTT